LNASLIPGMNITPWSRIDKMNPHRIVRSLVEGMREVVVISF
jgi:hypothetical protein